jgi:hypothetical protein
VLRVTSDQSIQATANDFALALCPSGQIASGGGYIVMDPAVVVLENRPADNGDGWIAYAFNGSATGTTIRVYAMCVEGIASATGPSGPVGP